MVYVLNKAGQPIMPTKNHAKVRVLLKEGKAKVITRCPFTIQLLYDATSYTQPISLGVDAGSKTIGISATTEKEVLFEAEVTLRSDIVDLLSTRRELRKSRRNRKTRHRAKRLDNRVHSKHKGWLAPSVQNKVDSHLAMIAKVHKILPISSITIELAAFDMQKLKADLQGLEKPQGIEYQQGEQYGFWNAREYVLFRDNHQCQCCKGKSGDKILNVHHIESRKTGGDAPNNLITLCETCHKGYHAGKVALPEGIKRGASFKDAVFMGIMRWAVYNKLKEMYPNVSLTYGYITKNTRIQNNLPKEHYVDARCISGHPTAKPTEEVFYYKKVRCHNRQIHKCKILKGGNRKNNQAPRWLFGYQLFDRVLYKGKEAFVFGRRSSGGFDIRTLDGTKLSANVSYKKLKHLDYRKPYLVERRAA